MFVFFQIFGDVLGDKNVSGVPASHYPLGHVEAGTGEIGSTIHVNHTADRPAMNAHAHMQARMFLERAADLHGAMRRRFGTGIKDQRHAITSRDLEQAARGFGALKLVGDADDLV